MVLKEKPLTSPDYDSAGLTPVINSPMFPWTGAGKPQLPGLNPQCLSSEENPLLIYGANDQFTHRQQRRL